MRTAVRFAFAFCFLAIAASLSFAQNTNSGDIRGSVTDSSGARMSGVTVTVANIDTGVTREFVTNDSGIYDTSSILPGNYRITFAKEGFEKYVRGPITLQVGVVTVDGVLRVGSISQEVVVSTDVQLLQTETAQQSTTLEAKIMSQLPQIGQNWANFAILLPGTSGAPSASQGVSNPGTGVAVNGNLPFYSNFLADGASTTLPHSANVDVATFETVSEVQINTSSFSAEYGIGGAVFNQISKGGTSSFHGAAYEYIRNNAFNARSFFDPLRPAPYLRHNNFGGSIGGPIIKKKLFFYFNIDKINNKGTYNGFATVPTDAMRKGDFSAFLGAPLTTINNCTGQRAIAGQILDPSTTRTVNGQVCRDPFPNNRISKLDPVATALQSFYPAPNLPGFTSNYQFVANSPNPFIRYFGRIDYDISSKNRLSFSVTARDNNAFYQNEFPCPVNCQHGDVSSFAAQISDVWTISPTFVNEFRFGYNRQGNWFVPASVGLGIPQKIGLQYSKADVLPQIQMSGVGCCNWLQPSTNAIYVENSFEPSDVVTLIRGKHILHFGGELLAYQDNSTPWGNLQSGVFNFTGIYTQLSAAGNATGNVYADFLLGDVQSWRANNQPMAGGRQKSPQFFVQDDIKLRPNLTLNLGLRYQIQGGWSEVHNQQGTFDPTIMNDKVGRLGAMWFAGQTSRNQLQANIYDIFLPRVGFAWTARRNMTIRSGFGIYAYNWSLDNHGGGMGYGSNSGGNTTDQTNGITPVVTLSGTGASLPYLAASRSATAYNGQGVSYNPYHTPVAKIYQWNFSVQREIGHSVLAEIAYVGSHGSHLSFPVDINQVPEKLLAVDDSPRSRPYPQFQGIGGNTYNAISNYNALQLQIQKRLTSGLTFNFNYTWSHFLDEQDSAGWGSRGGNQSYQNGFDPAANYANSNFDITHIFKGNVIYELPFGKARRFLNHSTVLDAVFGGWQASTIIIAQTGNPFTASISGANYSYSQAGNWYPNVIADPFKPGVVAANPDPICQDPQKAPASVRNNKTWFNRCAFVVPARGTFGNSGRNTMRGPGLTNVNLSLGKTFHFGERFAFQLRGDASNVFNHASFGHPNRNINATNGGQITSTTVGGRNIQLGGRFSF
jgi:hypothetical protein